MGKLYRGDRTIDGVIVTVDGEPLPERTDIRTLSRDGFEWSYEGDAPAQLALALYEPFMREVVANFSNEWEMTSEDVDEAVRSLAPSAGAAA